MPARIKWIPFRREYKITIKHKKNHDMLMGILTPMSQNKEFTITEQMQEFAETLRTMIEEYER